MIVSATGLACLFVPRVQRNPISNLQEGAGDLEKRKSEQDGADQPATSVEAKAEDKEETKPESEAHPQ